MSGLIKGIGKIFKKVGKFIKKNWKYIAAAVAVYFTAGVALSYFGSTAGFAASMPGFGTGGMFTSAASAIGFNGPAIAGAAVDAGVGLTAFGTAAANAGMSSAAFAEASAAGQVAWSTTAAGETIATVGTGANAVQVGTTAGQVFTAEGVVQTAPAAAGNVVTAPSNLAEAGFGTGSSLPSSKVTALSQGSKGLSALDAALIKNMSSAQKLGYATLALNVASGLGQDSADDLDRKALNRRNASVFGVDRKGGADYGWGKVGAGDAFENMNKRGGISKQRLAGSSQYAQEGGGSQFLKSPFDAGEGDFNPHQEFIDRGAYKPA